MLNRLPISLVQLQVGNNSEKQDNYCILFIVQKNITKQVYNNLIKHI